MRFAAAAGALLLAAACGGASDSRVRLVVRAGGTGSGTIRSTAPAGVIACPGDCEERLDPGTEIRLVPEPAAGMAFRGWEEGPCAGTGECTFTIAADTRVEATFEPLPPATSALTVSLSGDGGGSVRSRPDGIDCGARCTERFRNGVHVALTATPDATSRFAGWTGACSGTGACDVIVAEDAFAGATFVRLRADLTLQVVGTGLGRITAVSSSVACATGTCRTSHALGAEVVLAAAPSGSDRFMGWEGDCAGTGECRLRIDGPKRVAARFDRFFAVGVSVSGMGAGTVSSTVVPVFCGAAGTMCRVEAAAGTTVILEAAPLLGSTLGAWSGRCTGSGACRFRLDANATVGARFDQATYALTATISGTGGGRVTSEPAGLDCGRTCSARFAHGASVTVIAAPDASSTFAGWSGDCAGIGPRCIFVIGRPSNVTARFLRRQALDVTLAGDGAGRVTSRPAGIDCGSDCTQVYDHGTQVALDAVPAMGSTFAGWTGACTGTAECALVLDAPRRVTATFRRMAAARVEVTVSRTGLGSGRVRTLDGAIDCGSRCAASVVEGASLDLDAVAAPGSVFRGWTGPCSGAGRCTVTARGAHLIGAEFAPDLRLVAAATFTMGSTLTEAGHGSEEEPQGRVTIGRTFWVQATEVTQHEWRAVMGTSPAANACDTCPVERVSWDDAIAFTNALSARDGLERCFEGGPGAWTFRGAACGGWRLPTEAEWELFARGGTTSSLSNGELAAAGGACATDARLDAVGWYCGNASLRTHPVGEKQPNPIGVYDAHGNVAEWTLDLYDAFAYSTRPSPLDPLVMTSVRPERVVRGGSAFDIPRRLRSAARASVEPSMRRPDIGFRPVRSNLVRVPAGVFTMGAPQGELGATSVEMPAHRVLLTRPFWLSATELTRAEWSAYVPVGLPASPSQSAGCSGRCPVEGVSYADVVAYLAARSAIDGRSWRLPTEAEWERAARAGTTTAFFGGPISSSGCGDPNMPALGWFCGNAGGTPHPVGERAANPFGLHDVHGNVAEWVSDRFAPDWYARSPLIDPAGPPAGAARVLRGGAFSSNASDARSASRASSTPDARGGTFGFRPAAEACPAAGTLAVAGTSTPASRRGAAAAWTGAELLVLGGVSTDGGGAVLGDGARFDPLSRAWTPLPAAGAPSARIGVSAAWTGLEWLLFGGASAEGAGATVYGDAFAYTPGGGVWRSLSSTTAPSARRDAASLWTGSAWVVWGGADAAGNAFPDGKRWVPALRRWIPVRAAPFAGRWGAVMLPVPEGIFVFGGRFQGARLAGDTAIYDPALDEWSSRPFSPRCAGLARAERAGDWVVVASETGWCRFDLVNRRWESVAPRPDGRVLAEPRAAILAGSGAEVVVTGGSTNFADSAVDAYDPASDTWRTLSAPAGTARSGGLAVWAGCGLLTWSGTVPGNERVVTIVP